MLANENYFITGSKDTTIKIWNVYPCINKVIRFFIKLIVKVNISTT